MFRIDRDENRILALDSKSFSSCGFKEREHLQEWIAHNPEALGEPLLVIQKEFADFADTRERLDLLALDKEGDLVIIENKLDDTGRDVVWQAIKYASYCSSLNKQQLIKMYQDYLNKLHERIDAEESICTFLNVPDIDEVVLNKGNGQRLIFIAANFRKEVTSTALWLFSHKIRVQCFKVTPYSIKEELLLDVRQIIPVPEARDLMIVMSEKAAAEEAVEATQRASHTFRLQFWEDALKSLRDSPTTIFDNISPSKDSWICAGSGVSGVHYALSITRKQVRVEFNIERNSIKENKCIFDRLYKEKDKIEGTFGANLDWDQQPGRKVCRILYRKVVDAYDRENWPEVFEWLVENLQRLESAIEPVFSNVAEELKHQVFFSGEPEQASC